MSDANEVELVIGGRVYTGWREIDIERSIEHIAGCFRLELTDDAPGADLPVGLREGLPCEVRIGGETVITGYVDEYEPDLTEKDTRLCVQGRDRTADLVDCSAIHKSGAWSGVRLEQIVKDIAVPFGIGVTVAPGLNTGEVFKRFALEDGEKAFDAIDRACRLRAILCTSTPAGDLLLTTASEEHSGVSLIEGVNIKRIRALHTWKDRFSKITVKAQTPGDDDEHGAAAAHPKATAEDPEINRYRPLIVHAEHHTSNKSLRDRAEWEVKVRMGRGKRGSCEVVGWRTGKDGLTGPLWRPNMLVRVVSDRMTLDRDVLIVACHFEKGPAGRKTTLTFARPEAFELVEGAQRRRLNRRLGDRVEKDKHHKKGRGGFTSPWDLDPPKEIRR